MDDLREPIFTFAAGLPGAWEDHPWGEPVFKIGKKVFLFLGSYPTDPGVRLTIKLRDSHDEALSLPWIHPAGYGLDRGGWVSGVAPPDAPLEMLTGWIEESYRLVAPKRLAALLD